MQSTESRPQSQTQAALPVRAALVPEAGADFELRQLSLDTDLQPEEVLVRVVATGICQTDLHARGGDMGTSFPAVFGHEGAGVVERVGSAVDGINPGDHVVMSYTYCGTCGPCRAGRHSYCVHHVDLNFGGARPDGSNALYEGETEIHGHFFGQSSFSTHAIASQRNLVVVDRELDLEQLAPLGCGMQTGAGAVLNSLRVPAGASIAVFGTGGVGLAAVMAAAAAGASTIVAVDLVPERLELALELGATNVIDVRGGDLLGKLRELVPEGLDYIVEVTGRPEMLNIAVDALAPLGTAGLVGGSPLGTTAPIQMNTLLGGRSVMGIAQGDSIPQVFLPRLIELQRRGRFPFERLVRFYEFDEINEAIADMQSGKTIKPVLRMPPLPHDPTTED